jgi:hypothetical protein
MESESGAQRGTVSGACFSGAQPGDVAIQLSSGGKRRKTLTKAPECFSALRLGHGRMFSFQAIDRRTPVPVLAALLHDGHRQYDYESSERQPQTVEQNKDKHHPARHREGDALASRCGR